MFKDFSTTYSVDNPGMKFSSNSQEDCYLVTEETFQHISELSLLWRNYLSSLGLVDEDGNNPVNNVGVIRIGNDGNINNLCPSFFVNYNGSLAITVGGYAKFELNGNHYEFTPEFVEVKTRIIEDKKGRKTCNYYVTNPNGDESELTIFQTTPDKDGKVKSYCKSSHYDDSEEIDFEFIIPFVLSEEAKLLPGDEIKKAWMKGEFLELLKSPSKGGKFIEVNKAFRELFSNGEFPKAGIQLLLKKGKEIVTQLKDGLTISKVRWQIVETSHPHLQVKTVSKIEDKWVDDYCLLGEAGFISFTSARNNIPYHFVVGRCEEYSEHILLHIIKPAYNPEHSPFQRIYTSVDDVHQNCFPPIEEYLIEKGITIPEPESKGFSLMGLNQNHLKSANPFKQLPAAKIEAKLIASGDDVEDIQF